MGFLDTLKEKFTSGVASQQDAKWMLAIKEKYEELPPNLQKVVLTGSILLVTAIFLWIPISPILDSQSLNSSYTEKRTAVSELLKLQSEMSQTPPIREAPPISTTKQKIDEELKKLNVGPGQIKESAEYNPGDYPSVVTHGLIYRLEHLTIRQVMDLTFAIEQSDSTVKIQGLDISAQTADPHYYNFSVKIVSFAPKVEEIQGSVIDALQKGNKKPAPKKDIKSEEET